MKKLFLLGAMVCALGMMFEACTEKDNGGSTEPTPTPIDTVKWVDLGLPSGLLWAECNLGASSPEEYGNYYAWGETQPKDVYDWTTYRYCTVDSEGNLQSLTKYCNRADYGYNGYVDTLTTLEPSDDVVTVLLGDGTRIPTKEDWEELLSYTNGEWTTLNGVYGRLFTATNGNSLFLPAAGALLGNESMGVGANGLYWSSNLYTEMSTGANGIGFSSSHQGIGQSRRDAGITVRAVRNK